MKDDFEEEWRLTFELTKFENDDRTLRPLIICYIKKTINKKSFEVEVIDIQFFFSVFDYYDE